MAVNNQDIAIGIDLGTTNTCAAVLRNGIIETIPNQRGDFVTPSWICYTNSEVMIGKIAREKAHLYPNNTFSAIKRIIGRKFNDPIVQDIITKWKYNISEDNAGIPKIEVVLGNEKKYLYPEQISALLLKEMKEIAQKYLNVSNIKNVVITVPAYFNDHQRQATKDAAKIAGLNVLRLINEPTAAAIAYIYDRPEKKERNILVYDLGGGTFDVSIVSLENCNVKVKSTRGDTNLGGTNFDDRCLAYFLERIEENRKINLAEARKLKLQRRLQNAVEKAKHDLATSYESVMELDALDGSDDADVMSRLTRARLDDLNQDLYQKSFEIMEQCIEEANLSRSDIDDVVLVGGSTRIVRIQESLEEYFGKPVSKAINPDQAVAHGAAILAAKLTGNLGLPLKILDVTPMALGIETRDGSMDFLIERNSQIPTEVQRMYTTGEYDDDAIRITVLEGDSDRADMNLQLGFFDLLDLPRQPSVEVTFRVDVNSILTVNAVETSTGVGNTLNITLNKGRLSDREISLMRVESDGARKRNEQWTLVKLKRNDLQGMLLKFKETANGSSIEEVQKVAVLGVIEEGLSWMSRDGAYSLNVLEKRNDIIKQYCELILGANK